MIHAGSNALVHMLTLVSLRSPRLMVCSIMAKARRKFTSSRTSMPAASWARLSRGQVVRDETRLELRSSGRSSLKR